VYNLLPANTIPRRVVAVSRNEAAMRTDRKALRALGAREIIWPGEAAGVADFLEKKRALEIEALSRQGKQYDARRIVNAADLVIFDEQAGALPVTAILYEMSARTALRTQPHLILTSTAKAAADLRAAGLHALARPYSPDELRAAVRKAMSPLRRIPRPEDFVPFVAESEAALREKRRAAARKQSDTPTTSELFNLGLGRLKGNDAGDAERLFLEVLRRQKEHVGAALGMARICRSRDDGPATRKWLARAAAACLRNNDRQRAEYVAAMLPAGIRNNIFLHEAVGHMLDGEFREAARSFLDAEKTAGDMPLHRLVARGCLLTGRPEENMRMVCNALQKQGRGDEALSLRRRLLEYEMRAEEEDDEPARFPLLAEVLSAASFAVRAWKSA
jgi:hypothetical protein